MAKVVIDANVFISAAYGGGPLDAVSRAFSTGDVFLSPVLIEEIDGTIRRLSSKMGEEKTGRLLMLWRRFQSHCTILVPKGKAAICRDPKDDAYLRLCIAARADFLVTGDKDLLAVDPGTVAVLPDGLRIVTPRQFPEKGP
ncbi:MAG: putative toxin-antitoxin system toxin component, PIN family [Candidatus Deferrimicrobium sp.]